MITNQFNFISDSTLKTNVSEVFEHIVKLIEIVDNPAYPVEAKSAFCKTIIIHTGSIIEALLFSLLDVRYTDDEIKMHYASWQLEKPHHQLHVVDSTHFVVAGQYKLMAGKLGKNKINLSQVCDFLKLKGDITAEMHKSVSRVRDLRNEQHLSTQKKLKSYARKDVAEVFEVARKVKEFVRDSL
jgi:hypothetical protein